MRLMKMTIVAASLSAIQALPAQQTPGGAWIAGTWDMKWQTRRGDPKRATFVIRQECRHISAEGHGQGNFRASGIVEGNRFTLRGSRFLVPYGLSGTFGTDRIEGEFKMLRMTRHFTGTRR